MAYALTSPILKTATQSFVLVRHAATQSNKRARWHGGADEPISDSGRAEARHAARQMLASHWSSAKIVTSDLLRARQTAEILSTELDITTVTTDRLLREREMGDWKGLSPAEVDEGWPGMLVNWINGVIDGPPNGESDTEVVRRAHECLSKYHCTETGPILVVTHGGVIRSLIKKAGMTNHAIPHLGGYWAFFDHHGGSHSMGKSVSFGHPGSSPLT